MRRLLEFTAQLALLALFAAVIGYFSLFPRYQSFAPGAALVTLSFSHAGAPVADCRRLSPEELAALAPNMRKAEDCPRERVPVYVELAVDGRVAYTHAAPPSGLWNDGESHVYRKFIVPAGPHHLDVRLRDTARDTGFDFRKDVDLDLAAGSVTVVDFDSTRGQFVLY